MKLRKNHKMSQESEIKITGKNFLIALLIAFIITIILTFVYSCMAFVLNFDTKEEISISGIITYFIQPFVNLFKTVGICFAPIVFLLSFALLQRFRIKDNLEKDTDEEDKVQNLENL